MPRRPCFDTKYAGCRSGRAGVFLRLHRPVARQDGTRTLRRYFVARASIGGQTLYAYFSIETLGRETAWRLALAKRLEWEAVIIRLNQQTAAARHEETLAYSRTYYREKQRALYYRAYHAANRARRNAQIAAAARARRAAKRAATPTNQPDPNQTTR